MKLFQKYVQYRTRPDAEQQKQIQEIRDQAYNLFAEEKKMAELVEEQVAKMMKLKKQKSNLDAHCAMYINRYEILKHAATENGVNNETPPQQEPKETQSPQPTNQPTTPTNTTATTATTTNMTNTPSSPRETIPEKLQFIEQTLADIRPHMAVLDKVIRDLATSANSLKQKKQDISFKRAQIEKQLLAYDPNYVTLESVDVIEIPQDICNDKQPLL